ncbi:MAG: site-specific integrase [Xanthomonadales bacterium]|nr:site-specific integrase [Xanthomonadales bacterium]
MTALERYLVAATRKNTEISYAQAIRHFEQEFGGLLPTSAEIVAQYLATYAGLLSDSTLRQRLSALAHWHCSHGFVDPTRNELVRKTLRGIRAIHPRAQKQAKPIQLVDLERIDAHCRDAAREACLRKDRSSELRAVRDRALVLLGFWRAFRADDLANLQIEHVSMRASEGMALFVPTSKADRENLGRAIQVPALTRLCPVEAMAEWIAASELQAGPVFRRVDRWGRPGRQAMNPKSFLPLLRRLLAEAGVDASDRYSSHSLRRGFSGWATGNGWDLKTLMEYVGWRDIQSAARYVDPILSDKQRLEAGLEKRNG